MSPSRNRLGRILPYSGPVAAAVIVALVVGMILLVMVAAYVASQQPPASGFEQRAPSSSPIDRAP